MDIVTGSDPAEEERPQVGPPHREGNRIVPLTSQRAAWFPQMPSRLGIQPGGSSLSIAGSCLVGLGLIRCILGLICSWGRRQVGGRQDTAGPSQGGHRIGNRADPWGFFAATEGSLDSRASVLGVVQPWVGQWAGAAAQGASVEAWIGGRGLRSSPALLADRQAS